MSALMLNSINLLAQADSISTYSSFGIFDKVMNRFGEIQSWNNLRIEQETLNPTLTVNQGVFNLNFYEGCGLENTQLLEHNQRRQVFLELFVFANEAFGNGLSNGSVSIRFLPMNTSNPLYINEPIAASSYYIIPEFSEGFSEISDCVLSQMINGRKNPYFEVGSYPTKQNILNNSLRFSHLDFYLNLNSFNTNTDLNQSTIATNQIDLYSVALRELLISLGLNSMLQENGTSLSPNQNQYSRLDEQLKFGSEKFLVYNSSTKKYVLNPNINFNSIFNFSNPNCDSLLSCSLSPSISDSIIKLSISSCFRIGYEYTFINGSCDSTPSILERSWLYGSVRRVPSFNDIKLIESIGYKINGCFGRQEMLSSFCNNTLPELTVKAVTLSGISEFSSYEYVIKDSNASISYESFVDDFLSLESLEISDFRGANNTISASNNALAISFANEGQQIIRIRTKHNNTHFSTSYLVLRFRGGGGGCFENCNLVGNSSFENIASLITCGNIFPFGGHVDLECWGSYGSTTADLFTITCPETQFDFLRNNQGSFDDSDIPFNTQPFSNSVLHMHSRRVAPSNSSNGIMAEEAAQSELATELVPGNTYEISLRVLRRPNLGIPVLRIFFRTGEFVGTGNDFLVNANEPGLFHVFNSPIEEDSWQTITFQFECTVPGLDYIVLHNEGSGPLSELSIESFRSLFVDNIRLSEVPNATFNIPQEFSCGSLISSLQNFATPAGGVVSGPGVLGTTNFTFSPSLAGVGTHTLTYTVTTADGCVLTAFDEVTVHQTINFNNAVVNPTCGQACNGSITLNPSLSAPATVTYSWTGPSINSGNQNLINLTNLCAGTYTVTATINGVCTSTHSFPITSAPTPTASATTNIDLCSANGCNNSILVTTNSPNNTISWVGNVSGFNPTNLCPGSYTATVTSPQGCSVQVPVTINFTAGPNLTVSNTQTLNLSNLSYTNITVASGGFLTITTTGTSTLTIGAMIDVQSGGRLRINNAQIRFLQPAMLRVRQGGRVEIIGGRLSAFCPGTFWHGIEVWGTPNNSHIAVEQSMTSFSSPDFDGNDQQGGLRIISNATIEFAQIGVRLFSGNFLMFGNQTNSGGYITTDKAIFRNNHRDIVGNTFNEDNKSKIRRTVFLLNNNSITQISALEPRVILRNSRGVRFEGCLWSNSNTNFFNANATQIGRLTGLLLMGASCTLDQHIIFQNITKNRFEGFIYGVQSAGTSPNADATIIQYSDFRCYRGIYGTNWEDNSTVRYCEFYNLNTAPSVSIEVPPAFVNQNSNNPWVNSFVTTNSDPIPTNAGPAYGLYLNACLSTVVEFNRFELASSFEANQRVGMYVNNCGAALIRVHNNRFNSNTFGMRSFNVNRNTSFIDLDGTVLSCNAFNTNRRHLEINSNDINPNAGINSNMFIDFNTSLSNLFQPNPNNVVSFARRILATNVGSHFLGSRISTELLGNTSEIQIGSTVFNVALGNPNCGSALYNPTREELKQQFLTKEQEFLNFKDNGQTEYYTNQIESINSINLVMRFNELMDLSPAISTENILEILEKEQEIPRSMLLSILLNNISSVKNGDVLSKLEALEEPLTTWEKDSINAALATFDAKEILQQELQQHSLAYHQKLFEDYYAVRMDSTIANKDSVLQILKEEMRQLNPLRSQLLEGMKNWDWNNLNSTIEAMLSNTKEDTHEHKDLLLLADLVNQAQLKQIDLDSVVSNYDGFARNYISTEFPLTYKMAISLNDALDSISYHGDLEYDDQPRELRSQNSSILRKNVEHEFMIFPNPASDFVRVVSENIDFSQCVFKILDVTGRSFPIHIISRGEKDCVIDLESYANGTYFIELSSPNFNTSKSIIITR